MRVLVTGATGFMGAALVRNLARSHEVYALVRRPEASLWGGAVKVVHSDLSAPFDHDKLPGAVDVVIHLAIAKVSFPDLASEMFAVNAAATLRLLDYGRRVGVRQFILASSGDVYGQRVGFCKESDPPAPVSFYGTTKHIAELLTLAYREYLAPCILRLYRPYGPGQVNRLIPNLAKRIRQGQTITVPAGDRGRQTPIYLSDVLTVVERAVDAGTAGVFNVAGDEIVSMRQLGEAIGRIIGLQPVFQEQTKDLSDAMGENARMKEVFGAWPLTRLTEGLVKALCVPERRADVTA
jgi:nucleoside-diphosphate-sugar epimerase